MIDTERKEDLFLDTKLIKSENRLGKLRIIDELHPVLGGQPTHGKDQPNDNNPFLDLACTMQFTIDKVNAVDKKADTKLAKAQNLKDVANVAIARDNLGLGTSATLNATSTLSDRTDQTATIKVVNDVNRAANNAQTSANNANNKANAAQTRADSAYNLANSANNNANTRLEKSKNLSDLTNVATARNNLGLGTSATLNATSTLSDRTDQTATIKVVNDVSNKKRDQNDFDFEYPGAHFGINVIARSADIPTMYLTNQNGSFNVVGRDKSNTNVFQISFPKESGSVALTSDAAALGPEQWTSWKTQESGGNNFGYGGSLSYAFSDVPGGSVVCRAEYRPSGRDRQSRVLYRKVIRSGE